MAEKFGGFWTTGIWVMFKYAIPVLLFAAGALYFSPSARNSVVAGLHASVGQMVDLSNVPGLGGEYVPTGVAGLEQPVPPPPQGGFWFRNFGIGKPVVAPDTPRVRLSDLPSTGRPNVVRLSDLPEPEGVIAYRLDTKSNRRAPVVVASPRPRPAPSAETVAFALAKIDNTPKTGLAATWDTLTSRAFGRP